jgi:hypothetical protein
MNRFIKVQALNLLMSKCWTQIGLKKKKPLICYYFSSFATRQISNRLWVHAKVLLISSSKKDSKDALIPVAREWHVCIQFHLHISFFYPL